MSTIMQETTTTDGPTVDVLALTREERCAELTRFVYLEDGRYHLSGIKESAGIGSRNTHITLDQVKALHRELGRIINGLHRPASARPSLSQFISEVDTNIADLAVDAGVDADALQRHLVGEGPLSQLAYDRVIKAMVGVKAAKA